MIVYLVGMMGSGKTTIGKQLAQRLHLPWVDLDQWIEKETGLKVHQYIQKYGIERFRKKEHQALRQVTRSPLIVSCGGGTILDDDNVSFMREQGLVIYLQCRVETLIDRLMQTNIETRPLLKGELEETLRRIKQERQAIYESASHHSVVCDEKTVDQVCVKLIHLLQKN